jgi:hypothetical protein
MAKFIPVEPEKWAEMVKAAAASDYWRIEAETDHARWLRTLEENEKLRAEVERLRKAGDEVVSRIQVCTEDLWCSIHRWNAAKEGKQP